MRLLFGISPIIVLALVLSACSSGSQVAPPGPTTTTPQTSTVASESAASRSGSGVYNDGKHILYPPVGQQHAARPGGSTTSNLIYNGGAVMTTPSIYVVYWGWTTDPSNEQSILESFLNGVGGSSWMNIVTQYFSIGGAIANPTGQLRGLWADGNPIPAHPSDSAVAAEAARAASYFGISGNNISVVVATPHGNSTRGFGTQWCAYHSSTSTAKGLLGYTNPVSYTH